MTTTLLLDSLFALVLVGALTAYARRRDPIQRDVMIMFSAMSSSFAVDIVRAVLGNEQPKWVGATAGIMFFCLPYLTMRLISRVRLVGRPMLAVAAVTSMISVLTLLVFGSPLSPGPQALALGSFFVSEAVAAVLLHREGRRRSGAPRIRLRWAAFATAAICISVLFSVAITMDPSLRGTLTEIRQVVRLIAALAYLAAFMPPPWLRRRWSASAAFVASQHLLDAPATESPARTWERYADAVCETAGADAAVILLRDSAGALAEIAHARIATAPGEPPAPDELEALLRAPQPVDTARRSPPLAAQYAGRGGARFVTAVPLAEIGALILVNQSRSLFSEDDVRLLGSLGAQAAILAERGAVLAEQARLASELAESIDALQRASQAKSDFLASMSHELRTPLNSIIGFSELMRGEDESGDHRLVPDEWIEHIHSSGRRLLALINDILDLTKVESGRMELRLEPVEVAAIVHDVLAVLRPVADRKSLELIRDVAPVTVVADPVRLRQCLDNLLSNAIKFTPGGGRITVRVQADLTMGIITVADTGAGIAEADQERVFEEFQQVGDPAARQSGTGLGLALTRRLVQAHGGKIALTSAAGTGAEFTIYLPLAPDDDVPAPVPAGPSGSTGVTGGVLVIEDEPGAARLLRTYLEEAGLSVTVTPTGEAGLELAAQIGPDAIVLDVLLPGIDGWEVLRRLKADSALAAIPVIIATVVDEKEAAESLGAVAYFVKPIERHQLVRCVTRVAPVPAAVAGSSRILVIDDEYATLRIVDAVLRQQGFHVVTAASGAEGLRIARSQHFDLVICDLLMPDMDGFAVIAALDADQHAGHPPIVVFTAKDITDADRKRLGTAIIGIVFKGDGGPAALRTWLSWAAEHTVLTSDQPAAVAEPQGASS